MKSISRILLLLAALVVGSGAYAQPTEGSKEVQVFGNIISDDNYTSYSVFGSYGYYFSDSFKASFDLGVFGNDATVGGVESEIGTSFGGGLEYLFNTGGNTPFVSGAVSYFDIGEGYTAGEAFIGYKQYLGDNMAVNYKAGYRASLESGVNDDGQFVFQLGLSIFLD